MAGPALGIGTGPKPRGTCEGDILRLSKAVHLT